MLSKASFVMKNKKQIAYLIGAGIFAFVLIVGIVITALFQENQSSYGSYGAGEIPPSVQQWQPEIEAELEQYGREEHINLVLAITTQESGGSGTADIMQASESLGLPPNTIQDPIISIQAGVSYFDEVLTQAENSNVDLDTAIQAYNMGNGYIGFVAENGGEHSQELAQQFSNQMSNQLGWNRYGDPNYVENIKRYLGSFEGMENIGDFVGEHGLQNPYAHQEGNYVVSSEFSFARVNPVTGILQPHHGIDLAPNGSENLSIASAGDGVIAFAGVYPDGNIVVEIQHSNGLFTRYMHLATTPTVKTGQEVNAGDIIGHTGTTGNSTGVHLHFEIHEGNGNPIDPRTYLTW